MLAPQDALRLLAQYKHSVFIQDGSVEERKRIIQEKIDNCQITQAVAQDQMNGNNDPIIQEDICSMRVAALASITAGEAALRAETIENFNEAELEFRSQYVTLIRSVKSYLWDASETTKRCLWPLVEEVM